MCSNLMDTTVQMGTRSSESPTHVTSTSRVVSSLIRLIESSTDDVTCIFNGDISLEGLTNFDPSLLRMLNNRDGLSIKKRDIVDHLQNRIKFDYKLLTKAPFTEFESSLSKLSTALLKQWLDLSAFLNNGKVIKHEYVMSVLLQEANVFWNETLTDRPLLSEFIRSIEDIELDLLESSRTLHQSASKL
ncbi:hypothetical protein CANARDRAFT_100852 [[Candida] arabinofermentans NRRL YB-2248]|uniref:Uncharacterized protein n=1 Tax=[Candida] arabinofermentans NRRL YB-2248 TaxID=983967 RepID=A0A1E4SUS9_9ASCO|nr:hypothetical protein CANARDRAFT_100852 [[Candida] arabinofermentans NRRL YB-2248]